MKQGHIFCPPSTFTWRSLTDKCIGHIIYGVQGNLRIPPKSTIVTPLFSNLTV